MRRIKRFRAFIRNNRTVFGCLLGALLLDIVIELLYRQSLSAFWAYLSARPVAFLVNVLILTLCLSLCMFAKRSGSGPC